LKQFLLVQKSRPAGRVLLSAVPTQTEFEETHRHLTRKSTDGPEKIPGQLILLPPLPRHILRGNCEYCSKAAGKDDDCIQYNSLGVWVHGLLLALPYDPFQTSETLALEIFFFLAKQTARN
jgi:hypothetical protein